MNTTIRIGDSVTVKGWKGVAFRVSGHPSRFVPYAYLTEDEDGNEVEIEGYDGEEVSDESKFLVYMIGDDRMYEVDPDECVPLPEDEFCSSCGQIGCCHG